MYRFYHDVCFLFRLPAVYAVSTKRVNAPINTIIVEIIDRNLVPTLNGSFF